VVGGDHTVADARQRHAQPVCRVHPAPPLRSRWAPSACHGVAAAGVGVLLLPGHDALRAGRHDAAADSDGAPWGWPGFLDPRLPFHRLTRERIAPWGPAAWAP